MREPLRGTIGPASGPTLFLLLFFLLPLAAVLGHALGPGTLEKLADVLASDYHRNRILFAFNQALASTFLILVFGIPAAWAFARHEFPMRRPLRALATVPFVLPTLVVALGIQAFLGANGPIQQLTGLNVLASLGPLGAVLVAHVFYDTSLTVRLLGAHWQQQAPAYDHAARTLGAGPLQTFLRVHLPMARAPILATALLAFLFTFTSFGVVMLLAAPGRGTIETLVFEETRGFNPDFEAAAILSLIQLAITLLALAAYLMIRRRATAADIAPPSAARPRLPAPLAAYMVVLLAFLAGPMLATAANAFRARGQWSLDPWRALTDTGTNFGGFTAIDAVRNSLLFGGLTMVLAVTLGAMAAISSHRAPPRWRPAAEVLHLMPLGLSAVVLGLGITLTYNGTLAPDLRASPSRIVLAHTVIAFPFATRIIGPAIHGIPDTLRHAARTLGALPRHVTTRLELPLIRPTLVVAAIFAFAVSLGEFGATLLLRRPEFATMPIAIFQGYARPGPGQLAANAMALILMLIALTGFLLLERTGQRTATEFT